MPAPPGAECRERMVLVRGADVVSNIGLDPNDHGEGVHQVHGGTIDRTDGYAVAQTDKAALVDWPRIAHCVMAPSELAPVGQHPFGAQCFVCSQRCMDSGGENQALVIRSPASSSRTSPVVLTASTPRNQAATATSSGEMTSASAACAL